MGILIFVPDADIHQFPFSFVTKLKLNETSTIFIAWPFVAIAFTITITME